MTTPKIIDPLYGTIDMGVNARLRELYYSIYRRLLGTFEMDRADWLYQAGHLFRLFPGATHTRKAHAVGCWCVGCHALQDVRVAVGSNTISLMTWLDDAEHKVHLLEEFLAALLLHDVGHLPFSHAMEYAPELGLDHETIALGLLTGGLATGRDWGASLQWILTSENAAPAGKKTAKEWKVAQERTKTIEKTLHNLDQLSVGKLCQILYCRGLPAEVTGEWGPTPTDAEALNFLVDSGIDIDRIDHVLRDSLYSGLRVLGFDVRMLLQNLRIVTSTHAPTEYEDMKAHIKQPSGAESMTTSGFYFCISEDGISYVNYLLSAREACQKAALWAENNLFYVAALGHLMRIAKHVEPYLVAGILPFVPDRALLQMFRMDRFMGTPIPQYNKILLGETSTEDYDCSLYRHAKGERALEANEWERVASLFRHIEEENYDANPAGPPEILAFFSSKRPKNHQEAPKQVEQEPAAASRDQAWLQQLILDRKINGQYYPLSELEQEGDFLSWIRTNENLRRNRLYLWRRKETKGLGWEDQQLEEYGFTKVKQPLFA